jgi:3-oxoacyl-(acyl-carrier-protein) synthase
VSRPLHIVSVGAVTPVGLNAAQTAAAVRAAVSGFSQTNTQDRSHGPTLQAEVPLRPRPDDADPFDRLAVLAAVALQECLASAGLDARDCALMLGVQEAFRAAGTSAWSPTTLLNVLTGRVGFAPNSRVVAEGNASCMSGLAHARQVLCEGAVRTCIVGGVDSFLTLADTQRFGQDYRFKSDDVARGFVPGEGAAFVAVQVQPSSPPIAKIWGVGLAREDAASTVLAAAPSSGHGMEAALRAAIADASIAESELCFRASDMNGEIYRGYENLLASLRVYRTRRQAFPTILAAASAGETGAAAGALGIVLASIALSRGYAAGRFGMCEASSDAGLRGACLIGDA